MKSKKGEYYKLFGDIIRIEEVNSSKIVFYNKNYPMHYCMWYHSTWEEHIEYGFLVPIKGYNTPLWKAINEP